MGLLVILSVSQSAVLSIGNIDSDTTLVLNECYLKHYGIGPVASTFLPSVFIRDDER